MQVETPVLPSSTISDAPGYLLAARDTHIDGNFKQVE